MALLKIRWNFVLPSTNSTRQNPIRQNPTTFWLDLMAPDKIPPRNWPGQTKSHWRSDWGGQNLTLILTRPYMDFCPIICTCITFEQAVHFAFQFFSHVRWHPNRILSICTKYYQLQTEVFQQLTCMPSAAPAIKFDFVGGILSTSVDSKVGFCPPWSFLGGTLSVPVPTDRKLLGFCPWFVTTAI